jgi:hypothetical protein
MQFLGTGIECEQEKRLKNKIYKNASINNKSTSKKQLIIYLLFFNFIDVIKVIQTR